MNKTLKWKNTNWNLIVFLVKLLSFFYIKNENKGLKKHEWPLHVAVLYIHIKTQQQYFEVVKMNIIFTTLNRAIKERCLDIIIQD